MEIFFSNFYISNVEIIEYGWKMYYGYSEHFEEVEEGFEVPEYIAGFEKILDEKSSETKYKISFTKV
jgi:hypothetical protein